MPSFNTASEYTRSISDSVRLYCLNSESSISGLYTAGVLSVLAANWEDAANTGNILGVCAADVVAVVWAVLCLAVSTLILRLLAAL